VNVPLRLTHQTTERAWYPSVTHSYVAYGLKLKSQVEIQGLRAIPANSGVSANDCIEVFIGTTPSWVEGVFLLPAESVYAAGPGGDADRGFRVAVFGGQFYQLSYPDGTRFVVDAEARRIWGACPEPLTQEDLGIYLLGPVMGFVLRRRGILALHASCFCCHGLSFALCGRPGAGKSTTAAALALRGIPILCEDIAALREQHGVFCAASGYPRVNLWPDSAATLFGTADALSRITPDWEKRFLPLDGGGAQFESEERQLAVVYILEERSGSDDAPRIADVSRREAALLLVQNTYMNYLLNKEQRAMEFEAIARLVSGTVVRRIIPHSDPAKLGALCELLRVDAASIAERIGRAHAGLPR
jgi:hypothetical protein